jgi:ADP-ribosylglycohydrolase
MLRQDRVIVTKGFAMCSEHAEIQLPQDHEQRLARARTSLEGLSVGDALGEQFFYQEQINTLIDTRTVPESPWRYTDDTTMAISIFETLRESGRIDPDSLARRFAKRYWEEPTRGYGATAHRILQEIAQGVPWHVASPKAFGGDGSMGNGGAMRVGPVGGYFADDLDQVVKNARVSAAVTHAHPDGQAGAVAVAVAAARAWQLAAHDASGPGQELLETAIRYTPDGPTRDGLRRATELPLDDSVQSAAARLGSGSMVIASDTVPYALWCASRHLDNYEDAFWATVSGFGDIDTTCAIVGSVVAMAVGRDNIPQAWIKAREPLRL